MGKRLIFPLVAIILLAPWPVVYAYSDHLERPEVRVEAADNGAPAWITWGGAIGGVEDAVDLFYIDTTDYRPDLWAKLCLTNAFELSHGYRYLILKVGLYAEDSDQNWQKVAAKTGSVAPDTYLTMRSPEAGFFLEEKARYKLTIDSGSFYCHPYQAAKTASPVFYLTLGE